MNTRPLRTRPIGPQHHGIEEDDGAEILDEPEDEIWHVQVAAGDVRIVTLEKLDDLYRYDVIDENAFVWQKGMSGWVQLATLIGAEPAEVDEPFHVLLGPNNVKQLTLEQLDDYYRFDVINEDTLVWQKGMSGWQTLGKVAGVDAVSSVERLTTPQHEIATQPFATQSLTSRPPATQVRVVQSVSHAGSTTQQFTSRPPATQARAVQGAPPQAAPSTRPPVALALSAPPVAFSIEPLSGPKPRSAAEKWGLRLAIAAGFTLALLRNDAVHSLFGKTAIAPRYASLEASLLGGPSFGTTRSVDELVATCGGHLEPVRLPVAVSQFADGQKKLLAKTSTADAPEKRTEQAEASAAKSASQTATNATAAANSNPPSGPIKASETPSAKAKGALTQNVAAALGGMPVKTVVPTKAAAAPRPAKKRATSNKGTLKSSGSYFDPLNPTL